MSGESPNNGNKHVGPGVFVKQGAAGFAAWVVVPGVLGVIFLGKALVETPGVSRGGGRPAPVVAGMAYNQALDERRIHLGEQRVGLGFSQVELGTLLEGNRYEIPLLLEADKGTSGVEIAGFRTSCGCTVVSSTLPLKVETGRAVPLVVTVDTDNKKGDMMQECVGYVAGGENVLEVRITAHVVGRLEVVPPVASAGEPRSGEISTVRARLVAGPVPLKQLRPVIRAPWDHILQVSCPESLEAGAQGELRCDFRALPVRLAQPLAVLLAAEGMPAAFLQIQIQECVGWEVSPPELALSRKEKDGTAEFLVRGIAPDDLQVVALGAIRTETETRSSSETLVRVRRGEEQEPSPAAGVLLKAKGQFDRVVPVFFTGSI